MTFNTAPRSRNTVLSIETRSEEEEALRLEIVSATGQQEKLKRRKPILLSTPTIHEESDSEEQCSNYTYQQPGQRESILSRKLVGPPRHTLSRSIKSITGTVRGELTSAKQFLRRSSRNPLGRARIRSNSVVSDNSISLRSEGTSPVQTHQFVSPSNPVELSSDPLYQLEDNQRSAPASDHSSVSASSAYEYEKRLEIESLYYGQRGYEAKNLSFKSYSCDGCQQLLSGGDFYDFCAHCIPSDRVVCYNCAQRGGCLRHRPGNMTLDLPPSARSSPAPPYTHRMSGGMYQVLKEQEDAGSTPRPDHCNDSVALTDDRNEDRTMQDTMRPSIEQVTEPKSALLEQQLDFFSRRHQELLNQMQALIGEIKSKKGCSEEPAMSNRSQQRDQQAAAREQQLALREQELLLRERENLCRDREALMVRNLQSLAITQELVKHGQFGAQFDSAVINHASGPEVTGNVFRSKSSASEATVDLAKGMADQYVPNKDIIEIVARAQACVEDAIANDHGIRSHPGQKRKKGDNSASPPSTTASTQSSRHSSQKQSNSPMRPQPQDDQENSDEEGLEPPKRPKPGSSDPEIPQRIFACPYHKYQPSRYSTQNLTEKHYRNCSGHILHDIPRLKQHLKRVHWRPEHHCPRCYKVFDEPDQLSRHHAQTVACTIRECPFPEKMDKTQQRLIHVKKPRVLPETLWYGIYRSLFPGSPVPDSPYVDQVDTITPPVSAAPSGVNVEEVSQLMIEILNARLDSHQHRSDHDWLSLNTEREFIVSEVSKSVTELFERMSWSPTRSPANIHASAPPSVLVSPVDALPPPRVSMMAANRSEIGVPVAGPPPAPPQLQTPKPQRKPAISTPPQTILSSSQYDWHHGSDSAHRDSERERSMRLQDHLQSSNTVRAPINEWAQGMMSSNLAVPRPRPSISSSPMTNESVFSQAFEREAFERIAASISVDNGWDDQCDSYLEGDDQCITAEPVILPQGTDNVPHGERNLTVPQIPRAMPLSHNFVPVSIKTLEGNQASPNDGSQTNSRNKSTVSLIDSGYGSGSSNHSGYRGQATYLTVNEDHMEDYGPGHVTFDEAIEMVLQTNPWNP